MIKHIYEFENSGDPEHFFADGKYAVDLRQVASISYCDQAVVHFLFASGKAVGFRTASYSYYVDALARWKEVMEVTEGNSNGTGL